MNACPKCGCNSIIALDASVQPKLYECLRCNNRFHNDFGFTPSKVDIDQSVTLNGRFILNNLRNKNE